MDNFRKLTVWKRSVELATLIYKKTVDFPKSELYGLTSQIRRAAVSISSNIAEGAGRRSKKEFANFLSISYGSACELETQLIIARNLEYLNPDDFNTFFSEMMKFKRCFMHLKKSKNPESWER